MIMITSTSTLLGLIILSVTSTVSSAPFSKRIAQVISDSTTQWEAACDAAGGGEQCNPTAVNAFGTLLAAADSCAQQNAADDMIDLAKQLGGNNADMISLAQIFAQQPRNSPTSLSVQYCQSAPRNTELTGLFQCQFASTNPTQFVGNASLGQGASVDVGAVGTIPFGLTSAVSPPGSCTAFASGGVPDGEQLVDLVSVSGVTSSSDSSSDSSTSDSDSDSSSSSDSDTDSDSSSSSSSSSSTDSDSDTSDSNSSSTSPSPTTAQTPTPTPSSFALQNGQAAQSLNAQFATLSASDACDATQPPVCISSSFAQCVNGNYVLSPCGSGLICVALPLVNSVGTSVTCDTMDDALARIADTGVGGGLDGSGSGSD